MKEELELKHLAGYLPYELKIKTGKNVIRTCVLELKLPEDARYEITASMILNGSVRHLPILRPLSDLTKEIEVNGEKFVSIVELLKKVSLFDLSECTFEFGFGEGNDNEYWINSFVNNSKCIDSLTFDGNIFMMLNNDDSFSYLNPQYEAIEVLNKYHFDWKYGLIEKGLAVDINTLKK